MSPDKVIELLNTNPRLAISVAYLVSLIENNQKYKKSKHEVSKIDYNEHIQKSIKEIEKALIDTNQSRVFSESEKILQLSLAEKD